MVIGKKFWPINISGSYSPSANPGSLPFGGELDGTKIYNVDYATVTAIQNILSIGGIVGISGNYIAPGTIVVGTDTVSELTLSTAAVIPSTHISTNLVWWDASRPSAAGGDSPIQAVLCVAANHGLFEFIDAAGKKVTITDNTLVKGAVYYFQITEVVTVTASEFIGYSAN